MATGHQQYIQPISWEMIWYAIFPDNYMLMLVIGHFSTWVALVPYHTVMTLQSFTKAISIRSLAESAPLHPFLPEEWCSMTPHQPPWNSVKITNSLGTNRPWGREGKRKVVSNSSFSWVQSLLPLTGSLLTRADRTAMWQLPGPLPKEFSIPGLSRNSEEQRGRSQWTLWIHHKSSGCFSKLHLHCELEF